MFHKLHHITEGFAKLALIELGFKDSPEFANTRYEKCLKCDKFDNSKICGVCHCFTPAKVQVEKESCPLNKW